MKKKELLIKILQRLKESDFDVEFEAENICTLFRDDDEIKPKKLMVMGFHHHGTVASSVIHAQKESEYTEEKERGIQIKSLPEFKISPGKFLSENQEHKLTRKERREQQRKKP